MNFNAGLAYAAALYGLVLGAVVLMHERRAFVNRIFAAGMVLFAIEAVFRGLSFQQVLPGDVLYWQKRRLAASAFIPGTWLLFSLTYARINHEKILSKWKYVIVATFAIHLALVTAFRKSLFTGTLDLEEAARWGFDLAWGGKAFFFAFLLTSVLIVLNLEKTLRASTGRFRWQIKFMVLGIGGIFALRIYLCSQSLLYAQLDTGLGTTSSLALLVANVLIIRSLLRSRSLRVDVYLSGPMIRGSLTLLLTGTYLLAVGFMAQGARYFNLSRRLPIDAFIVFVALAGLAALLLSDRLRQRLKRFVTRHFSRPAYDYRRIWMALTERTASIVDPHELCNAVARMISESLEVLSVSVWLADEGKKRLSLAGSTVFTQRDARHLERAGRSAADLIEELGEHPSIADFDKRQFTWAQEVMLAKSDHFTDSRLRYAVPLLASGELIGIVTLNDDRIGREPLSQEDFDLLQAFAAQLAFSMLNFRLARSLREAKEVETFQKVSTFFVHDLKNLASRLSLTVQNLPVHFDNPEFRADALRAMTQSLEQIGEMCRRLSLVRQEIDLELIEADLGSMVKSALDELKPGLKGSLETSLEEGTVARIDRDQMHKVLTNLVLNASEALNGDGKIQVRTYREQNRAVLSVKDEGRGMSEEFVEKSLFRPFQTTKKHGLGIGLLHSKLIVEAHGGHIEVESAVGQGSEFRVVLPV